MTLGMNTVLQGGLVAVTQGAPGGAAPALIKKMGQGSLGGMPYLILIWILLAAAVTLLLFKMRYGRELFAVGNNATVAAYSGISVRKVTLAAYAVSGLTAGIAGMLLAGKVGQSYLGIGDNFQFQSIAAVAIGGTSLMGGNGNYLGTVAGAFTITIILAILAALNLPFGVQKMAYGIVVLISVLMSVRKGLRGGLPLSLRNDGRNVPVKRGGKEEDSRDGHTKGDGQSKSFRTLWGDGREGYDPASQACRKRGGRWGRYRHSGIFRCDRQRDRGVLCESGPKRGQQLSCLSV